MFGIQAVEKRDYDFTCVQTFTHDNKGKLLDSEVLKLIEHVPHKYIHCTYNTVLTNKWCGKVFAAQAKYAEDNYYIGMVIHINKKLDSDMIKVAHMIFKMATVPIYFEHTVGELADRELFFEQIKILQDIGNKYGVVVKACIDTCHIFSSGVNIETYYGCEDVLVHLNDSEFGFGSGRDRHATLGKNIFTKESLRDFVKNVSANDFIIELKDANDSLKFIESSLESFQNKQ